MLIKELTTRLYNDISYKIDKSTLQYYDRVKLIKVNRLSNNYRDYTEKDYRKVKVTVLMKTLNYNLATIDQVINKNSRTVANKVLHNLADKTTAISQLEYLLNDMCIL